ncbi:hypothetical protein C8035_v011971 [Colletotrichum spinosum]|uniref:CENP-V/GFA domain-containing protein n=1 Tax=Colletotrichum spinosum TaxID=1347390 RepID=A0A4R8PSW2_9PEZI|nr:hypothetical protein C8035_v011971 [Colletotrichum spinosum]
MIRVPLSWYRSTTHAFFPDERHSMIHRVFESSSAGPSKRYFCGFCGTPLSYWTERPHTEADYIHLTLASLCGEDLRDLEDLGLIPELHETEGAPVVPTPVTVLGRETRGVPWFDNMINDTRLGHLRPSHDEDTNVVPPTEGLNTTTSHPGKRKLDERDDADAAMEGPR